LRFASTTEHSIVHQNSDNDLFVLIPGCALPRRLNTDETALFVQVILDRRNKDSLITWVKEVRRYLVHNSQGEHIIIILPFLMNKHQSAIKWTQLSPYLKFNWVESREIVEKHHWLNTHFIAPQISDNVLFVQICAHAQLRFTSTTEFRCNCSFRGGYEKWINNMGEIRCYLYPVHNFQG